MAKSNYSFEKRQREVAKKKKKEKKRLRKLENGPTASDEPTTENHDQTKPD
jgi:hypothetical protein